MTDFDTDPEALAWARGKVADFIDLLASFEERARAEGDALTDYACGVARHIAARHFFGDGGDSYGVLDERLPGLRQGDEPQP